MGGQLWLGRGRDPLHGSLDCQNDSRLSFRLLNCGAESARRVSSHGSIIWHKSISVDWSRRLTTRKSPNLSRSSNPINATGGPGARLCLAAAIRSSGNATDIAYNDDPIRDRQHVGLGICWKPCATTFISRITFSVFRDRAKWFEKMDKPSYCLWWVPAGHLPSVAEGRERLEHYQTHGATPYSFWFSQHFPQPADEGVCV